MDNLYEARLARLFDRLRARPVSPEPPSRDLERQRARARVIAALPGFLALLSNAVTEANDRLSEAGLWLTLTAAERSPTAEALFIVTVEDPLASSEPRLAITVDFSGRVAFLLQRDDHRSLLRASDLFSTDHGVIASSLVDFLEARYPEK